MAASRRAGMRLDVAAETPVPESTSASPTKRGQHENESPTKRAAVSERPSHSSQAVMVDMSQLAALLEETGNKIMKAQHEHLEARMGALEELTGARMASAETRLGSVEGKVDSLESKLEELTKKIEQGGGATMADGDRKLTLVYGGWARDSRRLTYSSSSSARLRSWAWRSWWMQNRSQQAHGAPRL